MRLLESFRMKISRRQFLILSAALAGGCTLTRNTGAHRPYVPRVVNAGAVNNYVTDGVYATFWSQGFFIVRQGPKLFALSAVCTHRRCKLDMQPDHSFSCPCHGSTFDPNGHVTHGPARRDLPVLATSVNESGCLLVTIPAG